MIVPSQISKFERKGEEMEFLKQFQSDLSDMHLKGLPAPKRLEAYQQAFDSALNALEKAKAEDDVLSQFKTGLHGMLIFLELEAQILITEGHSVRNKCCYGPLNGIL
jgi:hypothetical protein